jgi:hypothetical protein
MIKDFKSNDSKDSESSICFELNFACIFICYSPFPDTCNCVNVQAVNLQWPELCLQFDFEL